MKKQDEVTKEEKSEIKYSKFCDKLFKFDGMHDELPMRMRRLAMVAMISAHAETYVDRIIPTRSEFNGALRLDNVCWTTLEKMDLITRVKSDDQKRDEYKINFSADPANWSWFDEYNDKVKEATMEVVRGKNGKAPAGTKMVALTPEQESFIQSLTPETLKMMQSLIS